jgi:protein phosphatase
MSDKHEEDTAEYPPLLKPHEAERPPAFSSSVRVDLGTLSHPGNVRPNNEDHFLAVQFSRSLLSLASNLPTGSVPDRFDDIGYGLAVADGLGGAAAGEVASCMAITLAINLALNHPKWTLRIDDEEVRDAMQRGRRRFRQIDFILSQRAESDPALEGMGTTMTIACSVGNDLLLYYAGDSRAYQFRGGALQCLTRDHTKVQKLVDAGLIDPTAVAGHPLRNFLTRALGGGGGSIEADTLHTQLADGDRLLLCTDGLTDMVPDEQIADVLARTPSSQEAARALVDLALQAGGKDNVTVVLAGYSIPPVPPAAPPMGPVA